MHHHLLQSSISSCTIYTTPAPIHKLVHTNLRNESYTEYTELAPLGCSLHSEPRGKVPKTVALYTAAALL